MLQRTQIELLASGFIAMLALGGPAIAQTAGEGSGSEVVGAGSMIKSPEHAEKGGDTGKDPKAPGSSGHRSDEAVSSGSPSPSTAPK